MCTTRAPKAPEPAKVPDPAPVPTASDPKPQETAELRRKNLAGLRFGMASTIRAGASNSGSPDILSSVASGLKTKTGQ